MCRWRSFMHDGVEYRMIRTTEELQAFAADWSRLWRDDSCASPFQSPEWLLPWWHQFGQPDLRAVSIWRDAACIGFLPFYVYREPQSGERKLLLMGAGTTDYLDGVFAPGCTTENIQRALAMLCSEANWDTLWASQLPGHSKLLTSLQVSKELTPRSFQGESCARVPALPMEKLPGKIRINARYYCKRAMQLGRLEFEVAQRENILESFETLAKLHSRRWQERGEAGVLADQQVIGWHREALPLLEQSGILRLCTLKLNGEAIGVLYSLIDLPQRSPRTQYFYLYAYSTQYSRLSPGTLLIAHAIEHAAQEGVRTIDMLRGNETYKQYWHPQTIPTYSVVLQNSSTRRRTHNASEAAA